jgi:polyisoprenoid-binding protein YceI
MTTHRTADQTHDELAGTHWRLDQSASHAEFRVPHFWGLVTVKGRFERLDGRLDIDENHRRDMTLTIDAASLRTGNRQRDRHLRSADFFDADNHPEMTFRATRVTAAGEGRVHIEGDLEVAGHRVALDLEATIQHAGDHLDIETATTVDQRRLGMRWSPLGMTKASTTLTVHARLKRES